MYINTITQRIAKAIVINELIIAVSPLGFCSGLFTVMLQQKNKKQKPSFIF